MNNNYKVVDSIYIHTYASQIKQKQTDGMNVYETFELFFWLRFFKHNWRFAELDSPLGLYALSLRITATVTTT